ELIDFYEDHGADRDKFEILAFHDGSVKTLSEMNTNTESARRSLWHDRNLPFPVLLDVSNTALGVGIGGATTEAYGIHSFPTNLLIDPEGKLGGKSGPAELAEKLTPLPMPLRIRRALDRKIAWVMYSVTLVPFLKGLGAAAGVPIRLDKGVL